VRSACVYSRSSMLALRTSITSLCLAFEGFVCDGKTGLGNLEERPCGWVAVSGSRLHRDNV